MKTGLLIGRFQPFHHGHLNAVKYALNRVDMLYIAIGSSQRSHEPDNPFTAAERIMMIKAALDDADVDSRRWLAVPIPDATAHAVWTAYIDMLIPRYDLVFSNDPLTAQLFIERHVKLLRVPYLKREVYQAAEIRRRMLEGKSWAQLVPKPVARIIRQIKGVQRIQALKK